LVFQIASMVGSTEVSALRSMLSRQSGQASSRSASAGTTAEPFTRSDIRSAQARSSIRPGRPSIRSRVSSWKATGTPSAVAWTSVSRYVYPAWTARSKAAIEFSSPIAAPPRWANGIGVAASRKA
jgi:hypothetical protein